MDPLLAPRIGPLQIVLMTVALGLTFELCFRAGRRLREDGRDARKSQIDVAVTALLTMLGLLLAFSFEMGANRLDQRKELVLAEAGAIATTYRQAALMPAPWDAHLQGLLREYVRTRIVMTSPEAFERSIRESEEQHAAMWADATAIARASPGSPIAATFISSLDRMIDLHEQRVTVGLYQRIPPAIFASLFVVSVLSIGMVGVRAGLDRLRAALPATILIASIMCVMSLITSLDAPASKLFHISKHAINATQRMMTNIDPKQTAAGTPH